MITCDKCFHDKCEFQETEGEHTFSSKQLWLVGTHGRTLCGGGCPQHFYNNFAQWPAIEEESLLLQARRRLPLITTKNYDKLFKK